MIDFERFEALTFDCYGTLIDWESGILEALRALAGEHGDRLPDPEACLELFGRLEAEAEGGGYRSYRAVLRDVATAFCIEVGLPPGEDGAERFAGSVPSWPAFADAPDALEALGRRWRLAIVSNVDDDLFDGSAARLGVGFDQVVTAEQVRAYKPAPQHFTEVVRRLDLPRERVLHVAQSLYHDIAPAKSLGFTCVWVNRRAGRPGSGATPPAIASPDMEVPDLATLARSAGVA